MMLLYCCRTFTLPAFHSIIIKTSIKRFSIIFAFSCCPVYVHGAVYFFAKRDEATSTIIWRERTHSQQTSNDQFFFFIAHYCVVRGPRPFCVLHRYLVGLELRMQIHGQKELKVVGIQFIGGYRRELFITCIKSKYEAPRNTNACKCVITMSECAYIECFRSNRIDDSTARRYQLNT